MNTIFGGGQRYPCEYYEYFWNTIEIRNAMRTLFIRSFFTLVDEGGFIITSTEKYFLIDEFYIFGHGSLNLKFKVINFEKDFKNPEIICFKVILEYSVKDEFADPLDYLHVKDFVEKQLEKKFSNSKLEIGQPYSLITSKTLLIKIKVDLKMHNKLKNIINNK